jgi:hypothetical protein
MLPMNSTGMVSALICGILFGYVLENAGFGSPLKLTAQFKLSDWSVFKVMFTAIVVAAVGLWTLRAVGLLAPDSVAVPAGLMMASAVGGAMVGAGFAIGGYCPGTSVVGIFSGRMDALVFAVGIVLGTATYAFSFGPAIQAMKEIGQLVQGDTFTEVYGVPEPVVLGIMGVALVGVFYVGSWFERRGRGPVTATQAVSGALGA